MTEKSKTKITKRPTGLSIKRVDSKFNLSWNIGDANYADGQYFSYKIDVDGTGNSSWTKSDKIGSKITSKAIKIDENDFYPNKQNRILYAVGMRVKGNRKTYTTGSGKNKKTHRPGVSSWSDKIFTLEEPRKPSLSVELSNEYTNVAAFSWSEETYSDDSKMFTDLQWETILVKNSSEIDGSKLTWNSEELGWETNVDSSGKGSTLTSGSKVITEDTSLLFHGGNSYIRWFRIRARGPRGNSDWVYEYQVYALSHQAKVSKVSAKETDEGGFQCVVDWSVGSNRQNPIDRTTVQYTITIPDEGLSCPSGASWSDANVSKDTEGKDSAVFSIDDQLSKDQCLFIRVNTQHDSNITYGLPKLAKAGFLKDPSGISVQTDSTTHKAEVSATNNSDVEDSFLVVKYRPAVGTDVDVGIIPHGETSVTVQCPDWTDQAAVRFEVRAVVGNYTKQSRADGVDVYTVTSDMESEHQIYQGGAVPIAPTSVVVSRVEGIARTVKVVWDWSWTEANKAEISWSDHPDAWESTDEPESYTISNLHASYWHISGLETGKTWYIRVRLLSETSSQDTPTYGPWSDINQGTIDLSSAPNKPVLMLSSAVIPEDGDVTAAWVYTTTDNTPQAYAEIAVFANDEYTPIPDANTLTAQHVTINAAESGWTTGNIYNLACRVQSESGQVSEWSDIVSVTVAEPLTCVISQKSLVQQTESVTVDGDTTQRTFWALTELPMTVTVTGAGEGGRTTVAIERAEDYYRPGPAESDIRGYSGETVALHEQTGEAQIEFDIGASNLFGSLDDGASYRIVAMVQDGLGQVDKTTLDFEVHWSHQAIKPSAKIEIDEELLIAKITPRSPAGALSTDVADIYRLSIDKPELIVSGANFGDTYVDPYPTLGDMGGHRIVLRTREGDYVTEDNDMAWVDSPELGINPISNEDQLNIVDFEGKQIQFYYDTDYSSNWAKDFQETQYLGGSIEGDWNSAVSRTGTITSKAIVALDRDMLQAIRRLAVYPGICHVRTADGSSYAADVQVSENRVHEEQEMVVSYTLSITRVDSQELDGIPLRQWEEES